MCAAIPGGVVACNKLPGSIQWHHACKQGVCAMPIAVTCPRCQTHFGITDDLADEPVCCPKCTNVFAREKSAGIQAGLPASAKTPAPKHDREEDEARPPSRPHATAPAPVPVAPLLILLC